MSVSENLIPNESITLEVKKHWIAPVRDSLPAVGLVVLAAILGWVKPTGDGFFGWVGSVLGLIQWGLVIAAIAWIAYNIIVWRTAEFAVTTLRVLRYEGFIRRRSSETLLSAVSDVKLNVGMVGKSLGYGDIRILTVSGEAGADQFSSITSPVEFRNAMMAQKMAEQTAARAPQAAVAAEAAAMAAAASVPPPAPAPASPSAADSTDAIKHLAGLRDQGLITPEEFEAKKTEILTRI
jgi:uncharacterized membrane protein YdbT with pleckstrin-like domain